MKRTNINLSDDGQRAILVIRERYGLTSDTAAIHFALREVSRQIEIEYLKRNIAAQRGGTKGYEDEHSTST
jgi:hypothetical protein